MRLVFTVPGEWTSPWILFRLLEVVDSDWGATEDGLFMDRRTGDTARLALGRRQEGLEEVFAEGSDPTRPPPDDALLAEIAAHKSLIQVSVAVDGDPIGALDIALSATNAVLDGGGLAVHVGTSGLVHGADAYQALYQALLAAPDDQERLRARAALTVRYLLGARSTTLGMHALGRPDVLLLEPPVGLDRVVGALERAALGPAADDAPPDVRTLPELMLNPYGLLLA